MTYELDFWDDRQPFRALVDYSADALATVRAERFSVQRASRYRALSFVFSPLLGHLPGSVQERLQRRFGAPAIAMTIISAAPLGALGMVWSLVGTVPARIIGIYFVLESGLRIGVAVSQDRPAGSLLGTLLYELFRMLRPTRSLNEPTRPPAPG